nr:MAG TPA: hypothetical protein [Bacteriophage sp.]
MEFAYFILIPMIIIWSPFMIAYFISIIVCICLTIKWLFSKLYILAEKVTDKLTEIMNNEKYLKFATISSYGLIFIIILAKILD